MRSEEAVNRFTPHWSIIGFVLTLHEPVGYLLRFPYQHRLPAAGLARRDFYFPLSHAEFLRQKAHQAFIGLAVHGGCIEAYPEVIAVPSRYRIAFGARLHLKLQAEVLSLPAVGPGGVHSIKKPARE